MAEHVSESLRPFEKAHFDDTQSESGTGMVRLIRTACKREMRSQDTHFSSTHLNQNGVEKNPLIHFRGNRFNSFPMVPECFIFTST